MTAFYLYTRVSTEEQNKKGNSHQYQLSGLRSNPRAIDGKELGAFSDTISGTTFERTEMDLLYHICKSDATLVDYIYVYRWDRFGRNVGEAFAWINKFKDINVQVNCPDQWIDFKDSNWPVIIGIHLGMAQSESIKISDRTKDGIYQSNLAGYYTASAPVGYTRIASNARLSDGKRRKVLSPDDKALYVREAFVRVSDGESRAEVYKSLKKHLCIGKTTFYNMLANPLYKGCIYIKAYKNHPEQIVEGKHEAIIDQGTFDEVQDLIAEQLKPKSARSWSRMAEYKYDFYLKGILQDADTGDVMRAYYSRGKSGKRYAYYDSRRKKSGIRADRAHRLVESMMRNIDINQDVLRFIEKAREEHLRPLQQEKNKIQSAQKKIEKQLKRAEHDYREGALGAKEYTSLSRQLRAEILILRKDLYKVEKQISDAPSVDKNQCRTIENFGLRFCKSDNYTKSNLLKFAFPEGLTIDAEMGVCRTNYLSSLLTLKGSLSDSYVKKKDSKKLILESCPVKGGSPNKCRTIFDDIKLLGLAV